jgi:hypothetical protein
MMAYGDAGGFNIAIAVGLSGARKKSDELTIAIVPAGTSFSRRLAGSQYSTC